MPGWSLWLVPPAASIAETRVSHAIETTIPKLFPELTLLPKFAPHITLTSDVPPETMRDAPQKWLDALKLDLSKEVHVRFDSVQSENKFFKKMFVRCEKDTGLLGLCTQVRAQAVEGGDVGAAEKWIEESYDPHCSLMYSEAKVTPDMTARASDNLEGIVLASHRTAQASSTTGAEEDEGKPVVGWVGGRVWLVATDVRLEEWKPVAERVL